MSSKRYDKRSFAIDFINPNQVACVLRDTRIVTDQDEVKVQDLKRGDRILAPETGVFDAVMGVFQVPLLEGMPTAVLSYPAQSVGNYSELTVSPGCRVFGRSSRRFLGPKCIPTNIRAQSQKVACRRFGQFSFFCVILQNETSMMANGAVVSTIKQSELNSFEAGQVEWAMYA